jgi:hypothetical protein
LFYHVTRSAWIGAHLLEYALPLGVLLGAGSGQHGGAEWLSAHRHLPLDKCKALAEQAGTDRRKRGCLGDERWLPVMCWTYGFRRKYNSNTCST